MSYSYAQLLSSPPSARLVSAGDIMPHQRMPTPPGAAGASNAPWPQLPDGPLAFDIYARRIAIPPCGRCLTTLDFFFRPVSGWPGGFVSLKEAIQQPKMLRAAIAASDMVDIFLFPEWEHSEDLDGGTDWKTHTYEIALSVHRLPAPAIGCWPHGDSETLIGTIQELCSKLIEFAMAPVDRRDADGFVVVRGIANAVPPQTTRYILPLSKARSAVGLPIYFDCNELRFCRDGFGAGIGPIFRIAPDLGMSFKFSKGDFSESSWLALHQRVEAALQRLVTTKEASR